MLLVYRPLSHLAASPISRNAKNGVPTLLPPPEDPPLPPLLEVLEVELVPFPLAEELVEFPAMREDERAVGDAPAGTEPSGQVVRLS